MVLWTEGVCVKDCMKFSPIFVYEKNSLMNALEVMKNFGSDNVSIINDDYSIVGTISKEQLFTYLKNTSSTQELKTTRIAEIIEQCSSSVVLYPGMSISEAYSIMKCLKLKCLPVADLPWERKITGYIWAKDIAKSIQKLSRVC